MKDKNSDKEKMKIRKRTPKKNPLVERPMALALYCQRMESK